MPGEFHGHRSLAGYSLWGHKESDTTEHINKLYYPFLTPSLRCKVWGLKMKKVIVKLYQDRFNPQQVHNIPRLKVVMLSRKESCSNNPQSIFNSKKSPVPENLLLCHISDSDLKSSNAFKLLLIFISKHTAMIIRCFMIRSQICTESSFFVKHCARHWGRMSCKPKPLPSWDLCCNRKCRLRRKVNK